MATRPEIEADLSSDLTERIAAEEIEKLERILSRHAAFADWLVLHDQRNASQ